MCQYRDREGAARLSIKPSIKLGRSLTLTVQNDPAK